MIEIQSQLHRLTCQLKNLDPNSNDFLLEKKMITSNLDNLRCDYGTLLTKLKTKQSQDKIISDDVKIYAFFLEDFSNFPTMNYLSLFFSL